MIPAPDWSGDPATVRERLTADLADAGVDTGAIHWLTPGEADELLAHWMRRGARRYGRLSINPPVDGTALSDSVPDDVTPPWLARPDGDVLVLFFRPSRGYLLARVGAAFVVDHRVVLARTDGDGFAAVSRDLGAGLLVNVEEALGDTILDVDAWGTFVEGG